MAKTEPADTAEAARKYVDLHKALLLEGTVKKERAVAYTRVRYAKDSKPIECWSMNAEAARQYVDSCKPKLLDGGFASLFLKSDDGEWVLKHTVAYEPPAPKKRRRHGETMRETIRRSHRLDSARGSR